MPRQKDRTPNQNHQQHKESLESRPPGCLPLSFAVGAPQARASPARGRTLALWIQSPTQPPPSRRLRWGWEAAPLSPSLLKIPHFPSLRILCPPPPTAFHLLPPPTAPSSLLRKVWGREVATHLR